MLRRQCMSSMLCHECHQCHLMNVINAMSWMSSVPCHECHQWQLQKFSPNTVGWKLLSLTCNKVRKLEFDYSIIRVIDYSIICTQLARNGKKKANKQTNLHLNVRWNESAMQIYMRSILKKKRVKNKGVLKKCKDWFVSFFLTHESVTIYAEEKKKIGML